MAGNRPFDEQVLGMIVGLASEVTVLRARLDACERLLVAGGSLLPGAVDGYEPDAPAQAERETLRRSTMEKVFRPLREAAEAELHATTEQEQSQ
ncbi:hypothetical protein B2G71_17790 [Novosphingobium sp. PC22D]|nr:hypothetical protein B2G71_17790 [Novosphingobium sp. PC22D]